MTAHPDRHAVLVRMYPLMLRRLDVLCEQRAKTTGAAVYRGALINALVLEEFNRMPKRKREALLERLRRRERRKSQK